MKKEDHTKISKQEKLTYILTKIKEDKISNYELEKNTGISQAGLGAITNGITKNPRPTTINVLYEYIIKRNIDESSLDKVETNKNKSSNIDNSLNKFSKLSIEKKLDILFEQNSNIISKLSSLQEEIDGLSLDGELAFDLILEKLGIDKNIEREVN